MVRLKKMKTCLCNVVNFEFQNVMVVYKSVGVYLCCNVGSSSCVLGVSSSLESSSCVLGVI